MPDAPETKAPNDADAETSAGPPSPDDARIPSRGWYGLAFVLLLVGVAAFNASINVAKTRVTASLDQMQRFVAPGTVEIRLDQPGDYLIYYEKVGEFSGETFDTSERFPELPKMDVDVVQQGTDRYLAVERAVDTGTQMYRDGAANSEFGFTVPAEMISPNADGENAALFTLTLTHENDIDDRLLMAVGPPVVTEGLFTDWRGPFGGAAVLAFSFTFAALTVLLTWLLRNGKITRRGH
ncbi:MAG: hypothetical protein AAF333_08705 [Planctomycetota bacterium]